VFGLLFYRVCGIARVIVCRSAEIRIVFVQIVVIKISRGINDGRIFIVLIA